MIKYVMPQRLQVEEEREEGDYLYGRFSFAPMEKGFATTIGNSLRRVLLSSIMSLAITKIKIPEKFHEYDTIDGVKEDVLEIIMNIKKVQLRKEISLEEEVELIIDKDGPGIVTAGDIICPAGIKVMNPELKIAHLNESARLEIYLYAEVGKGYVPVAEFDKPDDIQMIPIDGIFSPVVRVNYRDDNIRVGKKTDYDKLIMEIWTKKNIHPSEALRIAGNILIEHFNILESNLPSVNGVEMIFESPSETRSEESKIGDPEMEKETSEMARKGRSDVVESGNNYGNEGVVSTSKTSDTEKDANELSIEVLDLSVRSLNCLKRDKINTIGDLLTRPIPELLKIRNFGQKSLDEVKEKLKEKLNIEMDI